MFTLSLTGLPRVPPAEMQGPRSGGRTSPEGASGAQLHFFISPVRTFWDEPEHSVLDSPSGIRTRSQKQL